MTSTNLTPEPPEEENIDGEEKVDDLEALARLLTGPDVVITEQSYSVQSGYKYADFCRSAWFGMRPLDKEMPVAVVMMLIQQYVTSQRKGGAM